MDGVATNPEGGQGLRILGFGACMVGGVPHGSEKGFFSLFVQAAQESATVAIQHKTISLGGFPVQRSAVHLHRVLRWKPDLVVLQFGSTDITVDLRGHLLSRIRPNRPYSPRPSGLACSTSPFAPTSRKRLEQFIKLQTVRALGVEPVHGGIGPYLGAMKQIASTLGDSGIEAVVLAPFPHGDSSSDHWARIYSSALESEARTGAFRFVDARPALETLPKSRLLLADGLHLSLEGHRILAEVLSDRLRPWLADRSLRLQRPRSVDAFESDCAVVG